MIVRRGTSAEKKPNPRAQGPFIVTLLKETDDGDFNRSVLLRKERRQGGTYDYGGITTVMFGGFT